MTIRIKLAAILAVLLTATVACGVTQDLGSVSDTGKAFMSALESADHQASWNLLDPSVQQEIGTYDDWVAFATPRNFTDAKFSSTNVDNSEATMEGTAQLDGDTYDVVLVFGKSGNTWLITGINFSLQ